VDDDPSEVDWLEIEDDLEQSNHLAGKKPVAARTKKRGRTSASEKPREAIDPKEVEDPASKCRRIITDWPEDEDEEVEEVSGVMASSRRERLARRQELTPPLQMIEPPPHPPQPQVQAT
jgi:superfamily II helicase